MKRKPKAKRQENELWRLRAKIKTLERELVSALAEHSRALVQRNHAEEMTQSIYEALRRALEVLQR